MRSFIVAWLSMGLVTALLHRAVDKTKLPVHEYLFVILIGPVPLVLSLLVLIEKHVIPKIKKMLTMKL